MKVLFAHNHRYFPAPILRSRAADFAEHGIEIRSEKATSLAEIRENSDWDYDVLLLQEPPIDDAFLTAGKPVILMERVDGAQLRRCRDVLWRVAGVIKGYVFRDRLWYNEINDRAHVVMLHEADVPCQRPLYGTVPPQPQLAMEELSKIRVGYGFGALDIIGPCVAADVDLDAPRRYDVHFAGTVDYERTEVDTHRFLATQAVREWEHKYPGRTVLGQGRTIGEHEYRAGMKQSKVVLCPWGWGEATYRDYEAMALGAVVIKPDSSHVEAWPDVYQPGVACATCRPDFSDVQDVISEVVRNWESYRPMRERARKLVVDAWQPAAIAKHIAGTIKSILA